MSWRGQGGKRAKGRRGQDPELDNTAWLAELEREAAQAGDDEDEEDWASTLRGRRSPGPPPPDPPAAERRGWAPPTPDPPASGADPGWAPPASGADPGWAPPAPPTPEPGWAPPPDPPSAPAPDYGGYGGDLAGGGAGAWSTDPAAQDPPPAPDPDWSSWRPPAPDPFEPPHRPVPADPAPAGTGQDWDGSRGSGDQGWQAADVDTPTGAWSPGEPVGREPDYPALFGELYRRGAARQDPTAARQDPIWEAPPAAEPLPDQGQPDPPSGGWPFEERTGTWEPSDRSFISPAEELPATQAEWDQPAPQSWLDDPGPPTPPPAPRSDPAAPPAPDQTAAWPAPSPQAWADPEPASRPSPWASQPGAGNGLPPAGPVSPPAGPPPADWAAAIPSDVPAARRAADPGAATRAWRPDEAVEAEPGVPLGAGTAFGGGPATRAGEAREARPAPMPEEDQDEELLEGRGRRPAGERQARAWPRIVAVISWIVLVMVLCWYYVFPWLERVLPENF
jgi:hypothetical protein